MSEEEGNHLEGRYQTLGRRVDHLDNRVSAMAEDMSSIKTSMDSIVRSVTTLTDRAANPTPTNWVGIGSLLLALVLAGGGFVTLTTAPLQEAVRHLQVKDQANDDLHAERGQVIGHYGTYMEDNRSGISENREEIRRLREQILTLSNNQAYNAGTSDALKERVEGIDNYGSRRWIKHKE